MLSPLKVAVLTFVALSSVAALVIFNGNTVTAVGVPRPNTPTVIPLEIQPICSSAPLASSLWKVTNKNATAVTLDWNNFENKLSGSFEAIPGTSQLITGYNSLDPNNTTKFLWEGNADSQTNATASSCPTAEPTPKPCIDGHIQQNLVVTWVSTSSVSVKTANGELLCDDITVFLSSYTMPDNYNGAGFTGNTTAYPQSLFSSTSTVLHKNTDGTTTLSVALPEPCKNTQIDVYYGPEIATVGANGHGTQNIESKVYLKSGNCNPGKGGGTVTPPAVIPPIIVSPTSSPPPQAALVVPPVVSKNISGKGAISHETIPAELPKTGGINPLATIVYELILGIVTYTLVYIFQPRRQTNK